MRLYLLEQSIVSGYDTYDSCVVRALDEERAKLIPPYPGTSDYTWPSLANRHIYVTATYLGEAIDGEAGVVCASFNAG